MHSYFYKFYEKAGTQQNISPEYKDFVGTWLPGSPSLSHPGVVVLNTIIVFSLVQAEQ